MTQIKFEEPQPNPRKRHDWESIAAQLKARPNEWAVIAEDCYSGVAGNIKSGKYKAFRPVGRWETTSRGVDVETGKAEKIYARYVV